MNKRERDSQTKPSNKFNKRLKKENNSVPFSFINYWRMYKTKGIKLPLYYFFQAHLFDLINGTDTHKWLPKKYIENEVANFEHVGIYLASWTSEVKKIFKKLNYILGSDFEKYTFIDIGCGKGKVGIIWNILCKNYCKKQSIFGVDLLEELIVIAENNHLKILGSKGKYLAQDVTKINPTEFGNKFILYLYNPFDDFILGKMLEKFEKYETLIVYNNPVYSDFLLGNGYSILFEHNGFHGNLHTIGFTNKS